MLRAWPQIEAEARPVGPRGFSIRAYSEWLPPPYVGIKPYDTDRRHLPATGAAGSRSGYHDTHDTMKNIDLDYAAARTAIAIETVADVAMAAAVDDETRAR